MKLKTLKPRIAVIKPSRKVSMLETGTKRIEGRARVDRNTRWKEANPLCVHCEAKGITTPVEEVDHVIPLWAGGADDESNLQSLCRDCHEVKTCKEASLRAGGGMQC